MKKRILFRVRLNLRGIFADNLSVRNSKGHIVPSLVDILL